MKCPVCEEKIENAVQRCPNCGFSDLRTEFINQQEYEFWQTNIVLPYKEFYKLNHEFSVLTENDSLAFEKALEELNLSPREEKVIRMRLGLSGKEPMSAQEISKSFDVCVNRIYQIEAKFLRKLKNRHKTKGNNYDKKLVSG